MTYPKYIGTNYWQRVAWDPGDPVPHFHYCPECYGYEFCTMTCTLEPDLERDDGMPCGSHLPCSSCDHRERLKLHLAC